MEEFFISDIGKGLERTPKFQGEDDASEKLQEQMKK